MEPMSSKALASMLPGRSEFNLPHTARGIEEVSKRLGKHPFVVVRSHRSLDYDGYADGIDFIGSYDSLSEAMKSAEADHHWLKTHFAPEKKYTPSDVAEDAVMEVRGSAFALSISFRRVPLKLDHFFLQDDFLIEVFGPFADGVMSEEALACFVALPNGRACFDHPAELLSTHLFGIGYDLARSR